MNVSVIISSCDLYSDCWKPMFLSLKENWPNSKLPVYLISNFKQSGDDCVQTISVGEHLGWGSNTRKAMGMIDTDYVLLLQEDYFLNAPMSDDVLLKHLEFCKKNDADYLRIESPWYDDMQTEDADYCISPPEKAFSMCLQPAIWKRTTLEKLSIPGWTGWDYERRIHTYLKENNILIKSYVIHSSISEKEGYNMVHGTGIRKGIWTEGGIAFLEKHGFTEEIKGRKREGKFFTMLTDVPNTSPLILPAKVLRKIIQTIRIKF